MTTPRPNGDTPFTRGCGNRDASTATVALVDDVVTV